MSELAVEPASDYRPRWQEANAMVKVLRPGIWSLKWRLLSLALMVGCIACGDDEPSHGDGAVQERDGGGSSDDLPSGTAGKACTDDKECGGGSCATMLGSRFGGAGMAAPDGYCTSECMTEEDCGEGGTCSGAFAGIAGIGAVAGQCLAKCQSAEECRSGYRCVNALGVPVAPAADGGMPIEDPSGGLLGGGTCQPRPATDQLDDGVVGSACEGDEQCGDGRCLRMSGQSAYPGGYCSGRCLESAECGAGGVCQPALGGGAVGTCYLACAEDSDCGREGYRCRMIGSAMQCVPGPDPLPDNVTGKACSGDADCGGNAMTCATRLGLNAAPGGYCTQRCANSSDCGAGAACIGSFGGSTLIGTCYQTCAQADDCREEYTCGPIGAQATSANVCMVAPREEEEDADAGAP
jgi:hypothetical protein